MVTRRCAGRRTGLATPILAAPLLAMPLLGACSSDVNPVKAAYIGAGYGPKPVAAPDFVAASRRAGLDYMPVGADAPRRATRGRSAEDQRALVSDLEDARGRNESRGRDAERAARATGQAGSPSRSPSPD